MKTRVAAGIAAVIALGTMALPSSAQITMTASTGGVSTAAQTQNGPSTSQSFAQPLGGAFNKTATSTSTGLVQLGPNLESFTVTTNASMNAVMPNLSGSVILGTGDASTTTFDSFAVQGGANSQLDVKFTADGAATYVVTGNLNASGLGLSEFILIDVTTNTRLQSAFGGSLSLNGNLVAGHTYELIALCTPTQPYFPASGHWDFNFTVTPNPNVTSQVQITRSAFRYNSSTRTYVQRVTIKNISTTPITGPISLVLDSLSSNASLTAINGTTTAIAPLGSPYVNFVLGGATLPVGGTATVQLEFIDPTNTLITYTPRILAGAATR